MLGLLGTKKFSNDDLIKELLNPTLNLENLNKIKEKSKIDLNSLSLNGEPILIACCKKDLYNSCLWLLENKIDLELENNLKESAIFYTIYSKDSKLLETLLEFGANLNHLNNKNRTVLQESIHNANKKIVRFLIQKTNSFTNCDNNGNKDFSEIIKMAKTCKAPDEIETGKIVGGFAHNQVFALADKVVDAVKTGAIKKFFVMAGSTLECKTENIIQSLQKNLLYLQVEACYIYI
jgi:ankyrin repeat protein